METKKFHFQGTLLVPSKNIETSLNFFWAGSLKAENNEVFVIVFKAENKDEFVPLLEKDLKILQDMEQTDSVKRQIAFIEKTLSETKIQYLSKCQTNKCWMPHKVLFLNI